MSDSCFYAQANIIQQNSFIKRYKYTVDPDALDQIRAEKKRTGVGTSKLVRSNFHICPPELSADMIDNWLSGRTSKAYWEHVNWVLERYSALPTLCPVMA